MAKHFQFDPKRTTIVYGGVVLDDFADEMITITPVADRFSTSVGAKGSTQRANSNDKRWDVNLTFLQNAPSNKVMSAFFNADAGLQGQVGALPLTFQDRDAGLEFTAEAYIKQHGAITRGATANNMVWNLEAVTGDMFYSE